MEIAIGIGLIIVFTGVVILMGKANESLGKSDTNSKFIEGVKTKTNYDLFKEKGYLTVLRDGVPYGIEKAMYCSSLKARRLRWNGGFLTPGMQDIDIDIETLNKCELFTPLKEVSRSIVETEHTTNKVTYKVTATLKSRMKKNYTVTVNIESYDYRDYSTEIKTDKTEVHVDAEGNFSGASRISPDRYVWELQNQKGIIIQAQDIYEISLKEYKRPAKIKTTTITYA